MNIYNGNVGIGTTNPGYKLQVQGQGYFQTAIVNGSDRRWKKDITPYVNGLEQILALQGVRYNWRVDEFPQNNFPTANQIGFIAQDVEAVVPELVSTGSDGYKSMDYSRISVLLVEAVKALNKKNDDANRLIDAQAKIIQSQSDAIDALRVEIEAIKQRMK